MKKNFLGGSGRVRTGDLEIMDPACYQNGTEVSWYNVGFLMLFERATSLEKIFAHPPSQF